MCQEHLHPKQFFDSRFLSKKNINLLLWMDGHFFLLIFPELLWFPLTSFFTELWRWPQLTPVGHLCS